MRANIAVLIVAGGIIKPKATINSAMFPKTQMARHFHVMWPLSIILASRSKTSHTTNAATRDFVLLPTAYL